MNLFSEKTMKCLNEGGYFNQTSEEEMLLINGGLGCTVGNGTSNTNTTNTTYIPNNAAAAEMVWGSINTIFWGSFGLSCTLW